MSKKISDAEIRANLEVMVKRGLLVHLGNDRYQPTELGLHESRKHFGELSAKKEILKN